MPEYGLNPYRFKLLQVSLAAVLPFRAIFVYKD